MGEMGNDLEMKEGSPGDVVDGMVELQLAVKNYSKVSDVWGGRQCVVFKGVGLIMLMSDFLLFQFEIVFLHPRFDVTDRVRECGVGGGGDDEEMYSWISVTVEL